MTTRLLGTICGVLCAAGFAWAESVGAIGSRSAHEPGTPEETLEHGHGPRHGGYFGDADDRYHYELVRESPERLLVYVSDELNRPLDVRALTGRYVLNPDDPTPIIGELLPSEDGQWFLATLPPAFSEAPHLTIEVLKGGQWVGLEFALP